jgi:hypothetical protein
LRHAAVVTAEAISPLGATPFAGLVPWVASLWRRLRVSVAGRVATKEEEQVFHLIEFAASRFGDPLLQASSYDDLDDRLDALVASPEALHCTALLAQHVPLFRGSEPASAERFADAVGEKLGPGQGLVLSQSQRVLDAWLDAQQQMASLIASHEPVDAERVFAFSLTSPDIPAEVAELVFHSLRAGFCSMAVLQASIVGAPIERWLAHALIERLVTSAKEHLRLLASLPGIVVDEAVVPKSQRLDLAAIGDRHGLARAASLRSLEQARARLGL